MEERKKLVDYTNYFEELSKYRKLALSEQDKSLLYRIMNELDISSQLGSYLKFRDKDNTPEIQTLATRLINYGLIEERKSRLYRGLRKYKLTTLGIFHILCETSSYSPILLKKYRENTVLRTLLYSFFEEETVNSATARLYGVITDYLRQCCRRTAATIEDISSLTGDEYVKEIKNNLALELEWNTKSLAFKIAVIYTESNIMISNPKSESGDASFTYFELEHRMKEILSNDKKFMSLLAKVKEEFSEGCRELDEMK
ncbi:MAG TPA: hypothetical protein VH415_15325 [Nitrososphaeraceae archaeon]|jgi:hypothetical protein